MFAKTYTHSEAELLKWLLMIVLAGALLLVLAGTAMGVGVVRPPNLLPPDVPAAPMPFPAAQPQALPSDIPVEPFGLTSEIWKAIELQKSGNIDAAIRAWEGMQLPRETDHWRLLMLGVAHMQNGDAPAALELVQASQRMAPENAVAYYTLGLLWLGQAESADEWYDATGVDPFRLANAPADVPMTRSMYRLAATMAFERAVQLADRVDLGQPLLPGVWQIPEETGLSMPVVVPCVADALTVFGGERFEGRSHLALGTLQMHGGGLPHAEKHLDQAATLGEPTAGSFHDLGEQYEASHLPADAMRAHLKAFSHGGGAANLQNAWRCFEQMFSAE